MTAKAQRLRLQAMATALGVHIGKRIALARKEEGLETQQALADLLPSPINNQYISKWEGGVKPKDETLELIAAALRRSTAWFYEGFQKDGETPDPFAGVPGPLDAARLVEVVNGLGEQVRLLQARLATRDAEVLTRIEEVHRAIQDLRGPPPP